MEGSSGARQQFGNRYLTDGDNVYRHNAWDDVEWDEVQQKHAHDRVEKNSTLTMAADQIERLEKEADANWNAFYDIHQNKFFKNRHWLFTEFPELKAAPTTDVNASAAAATSADTYNIFEIGCGVGNTIFPILKYNADENLRVFGCDFSSSAIDILRAHEEFDAKRCQVFVLDATKEKWSECVPFAENSMDLIVLIFVLSAIKPEKMRNVIDNCYRYLKPGGRVLFRDYGRYDMAQLRFKEGKCVQQNFYVRGDGTLVYFFEQDELRKLFQDAGFTEDLNIVDRRLQINRGKQLKMYRVWIQAKYRKPNAESVESCVEKLSI